MLFELVKRIREEFASSRFELISQIAISDDEYEELLQYVRDKVKNSYVQNIIIKVVIKMSQNDEESIQQELCEYVITKELRIHFGAFFNNYENKLVKTI